MKRGSRCCHERGREIGGVGFVGQRLVDGRPAIFLSLIVRDNVINIDNNMQLPI